MIIRIVTAILVSLMLIQPTFAQGVLDSVLGPGGLGLWGPDASSISNPYYGAQGQLPNQQPGANQAQTIPPNTPGVYSNWQNYPAASMGADPNQMEYTDPQQYQAAQQQQQYPQQYTQPNVQQIPPQQYPQQQYQQQRPTSWTAPPAQPAQQPQLRPGQYSPNQPPQGQYPSGPPQVTADDLPAGAVRITTTTPDGTTVEYYPPSGEPAPALQPQAQQQRPRAKQAKQAKPKQNPSTGNIAMPKPVEPAKSQDPRYGWGVAPVAPE